MNEEDSEILREATFEIIYNQIESRTPAETAATLERLEHEGYSHEEAMKLIGCVVTSEIFAVLNEGREYNEEGYVRALKALPRLPWE